MSEKLLNRREMPTAGPEQTKQQQALQYLEQVGVAKKLNRLNLYHGRASSGQGDWQVDPKYNNAGNNTGNYNINEIPALNTASFEVANQFAKARSLKSASSAEIHHIASEDPDAVILDCDTISELNGVDLAKTRSAIDATILGITEGSPLAFEDRDSLKRIRATDFINQDGFMYQGDIRSLSRRMGIKESVVEQVGSAVNTIAFLHKGELNRLCDAFMDNQPSISIHTPDGEMRSVPINREYLANWFRENHIVGYKRNVISATLGGRTVENYLLFDLEKVNTEKENERRKRERNRRFGKIALKMSKNITRNNERGKMADYLSEHPFIKPQEIIQMAKATPGYDKLFEQDAGNWEQFKLQEHTETALRLFDKNYADILPVSMLPVMRMALLVHDIGKPVAVKNHDKANQKRYNLDFAEHFLKQNEVDEPTIELIKTMIGEGMDWTHRWMIKRDKSGGRQYYQFCEDTMKRYLGKKHVDEKTVMGFRNMLEVLQICDSAAYTTMAITRTTNGSYRNYGMFNRTFDTYHGLTGQRARIRP